MKKRLLISIFLVLSFFIAAAETQDHTQKVSDNAPSAINSHPMPQDSLGGSSHSTKKHIGESDIVDSK